MSDELLELYPSKEENPPYVFYIITSISAFIALIAIFALIYNKISAKVSSTKIVDDAKWS